MLWHAVITGDFAKDKIVHCPQRHLQKFSAVNREALSFVAKALVWSRFA
jgi:hypothetical protein